MTVVLDASVVVAALVDSGPDGAWASELLREGELTAPHLLPVEVTSVLRRASQHGDLHADVASQAHGDLLNLPIDLFRFSPFATRIWDLGANLSAYDAWYVSLAETLEAPLATFDDRLRGTPGLRCAFLPP